ncbi:MAG: hypothetical protein EOO47_28015 [Flavobacterium sp.]|nr:MAG: hypothetical protein EOO47_28015 [Flavobacterium sp.]
MNKEIIESELNAIWDRYGNAFQRKDISDIINRKYVYSLPEKTDILITGINPSFQEKNRFAPNHYSFRDAKHTYFTTLRKIIPEHIHLKENAISYHDIFYFRNTEQAILKQFYADPLGLEFLAEQLNLTQKIIEWAAPSTILVMNKGSWAFWGKEKNCTWMGYDFKGEPDNYQFGELLNIVGLREDSDRVSQSLNETNLIGTKVYFSRHLNRLNNEILSKFKNEISSFI